MSSALHLVENTFQSLNIPVALGLPSGRWIGASDPRVRLHLAEGRDLAALAAGHIGTLGEAVVEGRAEIDGPMRDVMSVVAGLLSGREMTASPPVWTRFLLVLTSYLRHSRKRDAEQIRFHYDVSDDFYALWLDPRRVYSCAYYPTAGATLAEAQEAKLDLICRKLDLRPGERFLDIGAGWGGLLFWAAEHYGVQALGITLSLNQRAHVQRLIEEKGLQGRVRVELLDYRDLPPTRLHDKIASVGMFEHVGHAKMAAYFEKLHSLLRPGGLLLNHGITSGGLDGAVVGAGLGDFIEKYIFPGGELIHVSNVLRQTAVAGLEVVDVENLRPHYAQTLWTWSDSLEARLPEAEEILARDRGTQEARKVLRAYRLYLAGCALAFERGWLSLHQVLAARPTEGMVGRSLPGANSDYPFARDYIYTRRVPG